MTSKLSLYFAFWLVSCPLCGTSLNADEPDRVPRGAERIGQFSKQGFEAFGKQKVLWLVPSKEAIDSKKASLPRLCAPVRDMHWQDDPDRKLKFVPEPGRWDFFWNDQVDSGSIIMVEFDSDPVLPEDRLPAQPAGDGSIMLSAHNATTSGEKLRYEPQSFKNTVGYWTVPTDHATWDLQFAEPGEYSVALLQGCGKGQGGSDAVLALRTADGAEVKLEFQTIDTGHFQNFRWNHAGLIAVPKAGAYQLRLNAVRIADKALFDVRAIHLVKQAEPSE